MSTDRSLTDAAVSPNGLSHVAHPQPALRAARDIVFFDPDIADYHLLAAAAADGIEVVILDGSEPGLVQIASALQGRQPFTTVHLVTHGYPDGLSGVWHGSMRQPTAVEVTATGGQTNGSEPQRQARGGAGGRPER